MDAVLQVVKTTPEPDVLGRKDPKDGTPEPPAPTAEDQAVKPATEEGKNGEAEEELEGGEDPQAESNLCNHS